MIDDSILLAQIQPWKENAHADAGLMQDGVEIGGYATRKAWYADEDSTGRFEVHLTLVDVACHASGVTRRCVLERLCLRGADDVWGSPVVVAGRVRPPFAYEEDGDEVER